MGHPVLEGLTAELAPRPNAHGPEQGFSEEQSPCLPSSAKTVKWRCKNRHHFLQSSPTCCIRDLAGIASIGGWLTPHRGNVGQNPRGPCCGTVGTFRIWTPDPAPETLPTTDGCPLRVVRSLEIFLQFKVVQILLVRRQERAFIP